MQERDEVTQEVSGRHSNAFSAKLPILPSLYRVLTLCLALGKVLGGALKKFTILPGERRPHNHNPSVVLLSCLVAGIRTTHSGREPLAWSGPAWGPTVDAE